MWVSFYYKMLILKMDEKDWWLAQSHSSILVAWTLTPEVWFLGTTSGRFPDRGGDGVLDTALFVVHIFLAAVASLTSVPHPLNGSSIPLSYDNQKGSHTLHGIKGTVPPCWQIRWCASAKSLQSCLIPCDTMDCWGLENDVCPAKECLCWAPPKLPTHRMGSNNKRFGRFVIRKLITDIRAHCHSANCLWDLEH